MNRREAETLGRSLAGLVESERIEAAYALLAPVLSRRTPFTILDRIGETLGGGSLPAVLDEVQRPSLHRLPERVRVLLSARRHVFGPT